MTIVTKADYDAIKNAFTDEEIKQKYGKLIVMSKEEYREYQIKLKRNKNI